MVETDSQIMYDRDNPLCQCLCIIQIAFSKTQSPWNIDKVDKKNWNLSILSMFSPDSFAKIDKKQEMSQFCQKGG